MSVFGFVYGSVEFGDECKLADYRARVFLVLDCFCAKLHFCSYHLVAGSLL